MEDGTWHCSLCCQCSHRGQVSKLCLCSLLIAFFFQRRWFVFLFLSFYILFCFDFVLFLINVFWLLGLIGPREESIWIYCMCREKKSILYIAICYIWTNQWTQMQKCQLAKCRIHERARERHTNLTLLMWFYHWLSIFKLLVFLFVFVFFGGGQCNRKRCWLQWT